MSALTSPYKVGASQRFIVLSLSSCILVAYAVGRMARQILVINPQIELLKHQRLALSSTNDDGPVSDMKLPNPVLKDGKVVPQTLYTSKNFDTAKSATVNSRWVVTEEGKQQCVDRPNSECPASYPNDGDSDGDEDEDDEEDHFPQGQHLLIDIDNVEAEFLNSEERLANAMLDLVNDCGLTLLSYHCHGLNPMGVSCAGVLLESHVAFHTWPQEGVITLDLFTCGPNSLLPIVPRAEELFSIPRKSVAGEKVAGPRFLWSQKLRGFTENSLGQKDELADFFTFPVGRMIDLKKEIVSVETEFQRIDIYDYLRSPDVTYADYEKSKTDPSSYQGQHPELFELDRVIFLDSMMQSCRNADAPYHESLVHPALFTNKNPKRVAIIGGGEGATLREVLKHNTVEKVVMIDIDEKMVNISREFLPEWSDCSNLQGSTDSCFEDPRADVYYEDAFKWFIDRFMGEQKGTEEQFDVIIMDALDPQIQRDFVTALYAGGPFLTSIPFALKDDGIFVAQVGESPYLDDPAEEFTVDNNRLSFFNVLVELGFASIIDYTEARGGFGAPWQYVVGFKDYGTQADWYADPSVVDLKIRKRTLPTVDGISPILYFDGSTMQSFKYTMKMVEVVFCRRRPTPSACVEGRGFNLEMEELPSSVMDVRQSSVGEHAGLGVFANATIPKNSYVGLSQLVQPIQIQPSAYKMLSQLETQPTYAGSRASSTLTYARHFGHLSDKKGLTEVLIDTSKHAFMNHGCNGSNNFGYGLETTEQTADPNQIADEVLRLHRSRESVYNPLLQRQPHFYSAGVPLRDVEVGEELTENYLGTGGRDEDTWRSDVISFKEFCS